MRTLLAVTILLLLAASGAQAAQVIQDPAGNATGIRGLELNGGSPMTTGFFDVDFVYGRGLDLIGGPIELDFQDQDDALVAAEAVALVLAAESTSVTTVGPVSNTSNYFDIPYQISGAIAFVVRGNSDGLGGWTAGTSAKRIVLSIRRGR